METNKTLCGECKEPIENADRFDRDDYTTLYYSCRQCLFYVCPACAGGGIRHEHREFEEIAPALTFMMTTLNGRVGPLEYDDEYQSQGTTTAQCIACSNPSLKKRCRVCKAPYCSRECLGKNWNQHRAVCRKPK